MTTPHGRAHSVVIPVSNFQHVFMKGRHCDGVYWGDGVTRLRGEGSRQTGRDSCFPKFSIYIFSQPQNRVSALFLKIKSAYRSLYWNIWNLFQAICGCFLSTSCSLIPLSGTHLESLRQLRLLRDGKYFLPQSKKVNQRDVLNLMARGVEEDEENEQQKKPMPKIQDLTIKCEDKFQVFWNQRHG